MKSSKVMKTIGKELGTIGKKDSNPYTRFSTADLAGESDDQNDEGYEMDLLEAQKEIGCGPCKTSRRRCLIRFGKISLFLIPVIVGIIFLCWDKVPLITAVADKLWNPDIMSHYEIGTQVSTQDRPTDVAWIVYRGYAKGEFWYQISYHDATPLKGKDANAHLYHGAELHITGELPVPSVEYMKEAYSVANGDVAQRAQPEAIAPVKILSYDMDCKSQLFWPDHKQDMRTLIWANQAIKEYDIIALQEQHESRAVMLELIDVVLGKDDGAMEEHYVYVPPKGSRPGEASPIVVGSGLITISKYEILNQHFHIFHHAGTLKFQSWGVAFTLLKTPGKYTFLFNTKLAEETSSLPTVMSWMISTENVSLERLRRIQLHEMYNFIEAMCQLHNFDENSRIVITGNFNMDALEIDGHDPRDFNDMLEEFDKIFDKLGVANVSQISRQATYPIDEPTMIDRSYSHIFIGEYEAGVNDVSVSASKLEDFQIDRQRFQEMNFKNVARTISTHRGVVKSITENVNRP